MLSRLTRNSTFCPVFGAPENLPINNLPTYSDVIKFYLFIRYDLKAKNNSKEPAISEVIEIVSSDVLKIWKRASLPTVSKNRVKKILQTYYSSYQALLKPYKGRQHDGKYKQKMESFKKDAARLFDICSCKCTQINECKCPKERKVSKVEIEFLKDQRAKRKMIISSIDVSASKKNKKNLERKERTSEYLGEPQPSTSKELPSVPLTSDSSPEENNSSESSEDIYVNTDEERNFVTLPSLALVCDRTGVSDRAAAMIASSALKDFGVITHEEKSLVVDRNKVRRERQKMRNKSQDEVLSELVSLYFDGRKDKTLVNEKKGDKYFQSTKVEDHYVLVQEPGHTYFGHVTCDSGSATGILTSILSYMDSKNEDLTNLKAVGCDGTAVNTGSKGGVIHRLELHLGKALQWNICLLHANELPLRHLFHHLDGQTSGPKTYSGNIGKLLVTCETMFPVSYVVIPLPADTVLPTNEDDLSTDQKYLLRIMKAVSSGTCSEDLAKTKPGSMSHSRWLTTANRILRLYIATENPSANIQTLANFIMNVYGPTWFSIKLNSSCFDGPKHVMNMIQRSRYLDVSLQKIVDPVIQRNAFYAHPENLLLSMLADESRVQREIAYRRIKKVRAAAGSSEVRQFTVPELNLTATSYSSLIYWQEVVLTEPPLTKHLTDESLQKVVEDNNIKVLVPDVPCHTQCVERYIKLVTNASLSVIGYKARDGFIRNQIKSRESMPAFKTKRDFV
uniref:Uncharacterized protein n=1 Tax=Cacopsylla melanoneura TaxID=428564 RepID=A0A8D8THB2_9HEMI